MMRGTPRTFIGPAVFALTERVCGHVAAAIVSEVGGLAGISGCDLDADAGVLVVTAVAPVDRTDILAVLDRRGCRVRRD